MYKYGMRLRGFGPWCQPMEGLVECTGEQYERYHDVLLYSRKLTEQELREFELDYIEEVQ